MLYPHTYAHPDHATRMGNVESEEPQWPHHFGMMGELLIGFIFLIVAFFLYMVRGGACVWSVAQIQKMLLQTSSLFASSQCSARTVTGLLSTNPAKGRYIFAAKRLRGSGRGICWR